MKILEMCQPRPSSPSSNSKKTRRGRCCEMHLKFKLGVHLNYFENLTPLQTFVDDFNNSCRTHIRRTSFGSCICGCFFLILMAKVFSFSELLQLRPKWPAFIETSFFKMNGG